MHQLDALGWFLLRAQEVDATWRELMDGARANPSCLALAAEHERLAALEQNNRLLDEIQKVTVLPCCECLPG